MSLPIIFKPLILPADSVDLQRVIGEDESVSSVSPDTGDTEPHYLAGVWVDGGLCNNLPLGVFDSEPQENPKTLGLRLNLEVRAEIATIFDYLKVWPLGMVFGTGESHISQTTGNWHQTIILDPLGLGLLDFSPETSDLEAAQDKAWESTFSYFGSAAPPR